MSKAGKTGVTEGTKIDLRTYRVLTVDPGLGGTGLAFWNPAELPDPHSTEVIRADDPKAPWLDRAAAIVRRFRAALMRLYPQYVVIEDQAVWDSSVAGHAASRRGDLVKLAQLTGMLIQATRDHGRGIMLLPVGEWKGQLPKEVVQRRIKRKLGSSFQNHEADAVGMGLHLQGLL